MSRPEKHGALAVISGSQIARDPTLFEETAEKRRPGKARRSRNEINGLRGDWLRRTFLLRLHEPRDEASGGSRTTRGQRRRKCAPYARMTRGGERVYERARCARVSTIVRSTEASSRETYLLSQNASQPSSVIRTTMRSTVRHTVRSVSAAASDLKRLVVVRDEKVSKMASYQ